MAVDAGTIYSEVRIELSKLRGDIQSMNAKFNQFAKTNQQQSNTIKNNWSKSFKSIGLAGVAAFAGILLAVKQAVGQFAKFEQSMANTQSVARGTKAEYEAMSAAALRAGETTKFTASEAADAMYYLASAGLEATEVIDTLDGVLQLAGATQSDLAFTSATVTAALSQFSLEAGESSRIANVFTAAIGNSQANMDKLSNALQQAGPIAGALGISLEETVGALQALFDAGFQGEKAGTALRNVMSALADETDPTTRKLIDFGLTFEQLNPAANSLTDIIGNLNKASLTTGQVLSAFGRRAGPQIVTLLKTGRDGLEKYTEAVTDTNAAAEAYGMQMDTLEGDQKLLTSAIESTSISFVKELAPAIRSVLKLLTDLVKFIGDIPAGLKIFFAIVAAGVPAVYGLAAAFAALSAAIGAALGPISLVVAGVAAVTAGFATLHINQQKVNEMYRTQSLVLRQAAKSAEEYRKSIDKNLLDVGEPAEEIEKQIGFIDKKISELKKRLDELRGGSEEYRAPQNFYLYQNVDDAERERREAEETANTIIKLTNQINELTAGRAALVDRLSKRNKEATDEELDAFAEAAAKKIEAEEELRQSIEQTQKLQQVGILTIGDALEDEISSRETYARALVEAGHLTEDENEILVQQAQIIADLTEKLDEYNEAVANQKKEYTDITQQTADYRMQLLQVVGTQEEILKKQRENAIAAAESSGASEDAIQEQIIAINNLYDALDEKQAEARESSKKSFQEMVSDAASIAEGYISVYGEFVDAITGLSDVYAERELENIQTTLDAQIAALDTELQARLEAAGVAEETELESLQRRLQSAMAEGDQETAAQLQDEITRYNITKSYEDKKKAAEQDAARETAQLEYEIALNEWESKLALAIADAAAAIVRLYASFDPISATIMAAVTGAATALQIATISESKPQPPAFKWGGVVVPKANYLLKNYRAPGMQTGGIVVPSGADGRMVRVAENGAAELMLNAGGEGQAMLDMFAERISRAMGTSASKPTRVEVPLTVSGVEMARVIANVYNNGQVRLER